MKRIILIILSLTLLLPSFVYGEGIADAKWIVDRGYFGIGGLELDKKINRAELATVTIRLMGMESDALNYKGKFLFKDIEGFQGGWATPYISLVKEKDIMSGKSKNMFNPSGNVTYVELLTVFMRVLGYEDGIDFINYPDDYYKKALEIGLGDMYISKDKEILREVVLNTMVKALNANIKDKDYTLFNSLNSIPKTDIPMAKITMENIKFNTVISGVFSGELKGKSNFTGYKVILLSKKGNIHGSEVLGRNGKFSIEGFDVGVLAKLNGFKYEVYDQEGNLILESQLQ